MDIEMDPQGILGASFNYLHNQGPTEWTLLPSHFSFRLYSFGRLSLHSNKLHLSIYCKQCFNSWVAVVLCLCSDACCEDEGDTCRGVRVNWVGLEDKLSWWTLARSGLVSTRKLKDFHPGCEILCNNVLSPFIFCGCVEQVFPKFLVLCWSKENRSIDTPAYLCGINTSFTTWIFKIFLQ